MQKTSLLTRRSLLATGAAASISSALAPVISGAAAANETAATEFHPHGSGYYRFTIGDFKATVISDGYGYVPFWPVFAANRQAADVEGFLKENRLPATPEFTNNMLVVDTPTERILVDTGFGDVLGPPSGTFPYLNSNLERAGISRDSITTVVISHVHLDHVAGIVNKSGEHLFPKARYVLVDDEVTYWTGNRFEADINASKAPPEFKQAAIFAAKNYLPPIRQRMHVVRPGAEIAPGITLIPAPGHSPAHTAIRFSSGNAEFIHMADVAHRSDSGLQHPEWSIVFDYDGEQSIATRKKILGQVAADRTLVMGYHFPFPGIGFVERAGAAYRWVPLPWSWS